MDVLEHAMDVVGAGVRDYVEDVSRGHTKFRGVTVRYRLHFAHVRIGNWEEAEPVAVLLAVNHAVHLVVDAVQQAIGIDGSGNSQFGIGMATHARLKQNEVVRIARCQRKVLDFLGIDRSAHVHACRFDHRRATGDFNRGRDARQRHAGIDHRLLASLQ